MLWPMDREVSCSAAPQGACIVLATGRSIGFYFLSHFAAAVSETSSRGRPQVESSSFSPGAFGVAFAGEWGGPVMTHRAAAQRLAISPRREVRSPSSPYVVTSSTECRL